MFSKAFVAFVGLAASVHASCIHGTSLMRRQEGAVQVSQFGYDDLNGPLNWAGLDPANSACATSNVQSPIVIDSSIPFAQEAPVLTINNVAEAEFENLGTTLETIVTGNTLFNGVNFTLQQFHLHTPSEHRINSEFFPMEMHMVHEAADGSIAVIAIPFQLSEDGSTTQLLTAVTQNLAQVAQPGTRTTTGALDFTELIAAVQGTPLFQYTGSLTTPPCAEGLTFLVMSQPLPVDVRTFNALKSVIKFNARYTQNKLGQTNLLNVAADLAVRSGFVGGDNVGAGIGAVALNNSNVDANGNVVNVNDQSAVDVVALVQTLVAQNQNLRFETQTNTVTNVIVNGQVIGGVQGGVPPVAPVLGQVINGQIVNEAGQVIDVNNKGNKKDDKEKGRPNKLNEHQPKKEDQHLAKIQRSRIGRRLNSRSPAAKRRL